MNSIKRFLSLSLCMLVFTGVRAWGLPLNGIGTAAFPAQAQGQPAQEPAQSTTFTGTIAKFGEQSGGGTIYVLRDSSGAVYKLDDPERAKPFVGKSVKVTGKLDAGAKVIHVDSIEGA
jgi:hypothetical protein